MANPGSGVSVLPSGGSFSRQWTNPSAIVNNQCDSTAGTFADFSTGSTLPSYYLFSYLYPNQLIGTDISSITSFNVDIFRYTSISNGIQHPQITDVTVSFASGNSTTNPTSVTLWGNNNAASGTPWDSGISCVDKSYQGGWDSYWGLTAYQAAMIASGDPHLGVVLNVLNNNKPACKAVVQTINFNLTQLQSVNNNIPLFLYNPVGTPISGSLPLLISGPFIQNNSLPLFLNGPVTQTGSLPLFLQNTVGFQCFGPFYPKNVAVNSGLGQWGWANPTYIEAADNLRATSTINQAQGQSYQLIATQFQLGSGVNGITIPTNFQPSGIYFTFERSQNVSDDSIFDSGIYLVTNYTVQSGTDRSIGVWGTDEHPGTIIGGQTDMWGRSSPLQYSDITASGFGVAFRAGTNSLGAGTAYVDVVSCTVCGIVSNVLQSLPLFMPVSATSTNAIPLFTWGSTLTSSGIPLYIDGYTTTNSGIPLFLQWVGSGNNNIPLFLENINPASGHIPLYISGGFIRHASGSISLFLGGQPIFNSAGGIPLTLSNLSSASGGGGQFVTIPLFLASANFHNNISLYLAVPSIGTVSDGCTLYTIGNLRSSNSNLPLFLENWATNAAIPLFIENLSNSPNAQVDDTGFYPFVGNLALYLGGPFNQTMPLFLASNTPQSGNIPLFLSGGSGLNNNLPLFLKTGYASGNSILPLFTRGF